MSSSIAENLTAVKRRIAAAAERVGRNPGDITLVVVTKKFSAEMVVEAVKAGAEVLGENRAREAADKYAVLGGMVGSRHISWHFIGYLQTNKVKQIIGLADLIHSVDRVELALEIDKRARVAGKIQPVLIEVNMGGEAAKAGARAADASTLARQAEELPNLRVTGLMTMAQIASDPEETRVVFAGLRGLRDEIRQDFLPGCAELSMGMTDDFEVAIEEGATIVRIGRAIMGPRPLA